MVTRNEELARIRGFLDGYAGTAQDKREIFLVSRKTKSDLMRTFTPEDTGYKWLSWQGVNVVEFDGALDKELYVAKQVLQ